MKQTAQHTPGPWELVPTVHSDRLIIFGAAPTKEYCIGTLISGSRVELPTLRANARLIAAAPELFDTLTFALHALNTVPRFPVGDTDSYKIAAICERAIAKAKGGAA